MSERSRLLERLRRLLGLEDGGEAASPEPAAPYGDGDLPPGCEHVEEISCEEAARKVYEFLDGELDDEDAEEVRCHVEQCRLCYPYFNWEELFLDALKERADRPESSRELRERVDDLLDREIG